MFKETMPSPEEQEKFLERERIKAKARQKAHKGMGKEMDEIASKSDEERKESLKEFEPDEKEKKERGE